MNTPLEASTESEIMRLFREWQRVEAIEVTDENVSALVREQNEIEQKMHVFRAITAQELEIAVAYDLLQIANITVGQAFQCAVSFAHSADEMRNGYPTRMPGVPFNAPHGTMMGVSAAGRCAIVATEGALNPLPDLRRALLARSFVILDLNDLFIRLCAGLGLNPSAVLVEAYGDGSATASLVAEG